MSKKKHSRLHRFDLMQHPKLDGSKPPEQPEPEVYQRFRKEVPARSTAYISPYHRIDGVAIFNTSAFHKLKLEVILTSDGVIHLSVCGGYPSD